MGLRSNAFVVLAACAVLCVILISRPLAEPPTAAAPARIAESSALRRDLGALRETLRSEQAAAAATKRRSEEASKRRSEAAAAALRDEQQAAAVSLSKQAAAAKLRREQAAAAAQQAAATAQQAAAPPQQAPPQQAPPQPAPPRHAPPEPRLELTPAPTSVSSPRAAVLIVGIARSLFLPRVHVLTRRYLVDALASRGARVDVFLRLDKTIQKTEGSEAQRHGGGGARGIAERAGTLPESVLAPMLAALRPRKTSWFVAGGDEGAADADVFRAGGALRPWASLSNASRGVALMRAFDRPLWSQLWNRAVARADAVAYGKARASLRRRAGGAARGRFLDMDAAGAWWCFGNAYGGSPFHTTTPRSARASRRPSPPPCRRAWGPSGGRRRRVIADDVVDHYCCTGDRGTLFNTDVGHTEHLLARKICGVAGKHACGDHFGGFKHLDMRRLVQTVVRSTGGADCGRLINYQGNKAIRAFGRPSVANYLTSPWRPRLRVGLGSIIAMHNVGLVQKYLMRFLTNERQQLPDASHVVEGKPIAVLSLIWWIISHHTADGFDGDPQAVRCAILGWATRRCARAGLVPEALEQPGGAGATGSKARRKGPAGYFSLSEDRVRDGRVFLALLHATDPNRFPYDPTDDVRRNISKAFERARSAYEVPVLLDAADEGCMRQEPLVLTYLSELRAALPARCAAPKRAGTVNAPPTWPPRRLGALARHVADPWAEECLRERGGWVGDVERMYPYRPTRHVFVAAAAALLKDALAFEEKLGDERDPRTMRRRQAFLSLIKQVAEPGNLRRMWTAREDGSLEALQAALKDAGVGDGRDREALARLLLDPNVLGDAGRGEPLSPRALASSLFGSPGGGGGDTAVADVAARISLPLARRGARRGDYDACTKARGSKKERREFAFARARANYGVPELDASDPRFSHLTEAQDALGLYVSELAAAAGAAGAVGSKRGGWRRIPADDVLGDPGDYSRQLLHFSRASLHAGGDLDGEALEEAKARSSTRTSRRPSRPARDCSRC
ncbi:hypothetical protein JL722_7211 [Aureococcus anophagefferens]|nr:hypothetical protein JL722_7211 [Aureococcus anophagefferens]